MSRAWIRSFAPAAPGLAVTVALALAGCGGKGEGVDDGQVTTEPGTQVAASTSTGGGAAPAGGGSTAPAAEKAPASTGGGAEAAPVKAEGFGTLKGKVVFDGDAPAVKVLVAQGKAEKDPTICAAKSPINSERLVVDPATKGVKYALVYIPRPTAVSEEAKSAALGATYEFDQQGCVFKPHVLGLMKGVKLTVRSSDAVGHNVNSKVENNTFNTAVPVNTALPTMEIKSTSSRPGNVVCDIHPWMSSWWMVINNPYIAVTDEKGNFELKNVPAGTQKVVVWQEAVHPKFVTASSGDPITIKANGETEQVFHIKPDQINAQ
jgi:hypothetical protein